MISAPDTSTELVAYTNASFFWSATGGEGSKTYSWYLDPVEADYGNASTLTDVTYLGLGDDDSVKTYTFYVEAEDEGGHTEIVSATFSVQPTVAAEPDTTTPTVAITSSPIEDSYVATGSSVSFTWAGDDGNGNNDVLVYQYAFPTIDDTSNTWLEITTKTFDNVGVANPATFYVRAKDQADHVSDWDSVSFIVRNATILYVDDYLWLDALGDVDRAKERDQKQFYRNALEGYAFAEWDIAVQGIPTDGDLASYTTVIWCADSYVGTEDGTWADADFVDDMDIYLTGGGNLLLAGVWPLLDRSYSGGDFLTFPGDFEYEWCGVDSSVIDEIDTTWWLDEVPYDTLIVSPDSVTADTSWTWSVDYWNEFTWAVKDPASTLDLPDSMKIDVAKIGGQLDYGCQVYGFRDDATVTTDPMYNWGLDVNGEEGNAYGEPIGYIVNISSTPRTAMLNFDVYSMPPEGIRRTFQAILTEFGE
jgi:hypothetical protein